MPKLLGALLLVILVCCSQAGAQDTGIGLGVIAGEPTGLSAKFWLNKTGAIDAAAAWSVTGSNKFQLHADYLYHFFDLIPVPKGKLPLLGTFVSMAGPGWLQSALTLGGGSPDLILDLALDGNATDGSSYNNDGQLNGGESVQKPDMFGVSNQQESQDQHRPRQVCNDKDVLPIEPVGHDSSQGADHKR